MGALMVHLRDHAGDPIAGKRVFVNLVGTFVDSHSEDYTDGDGTVDFNDIPTGKVEVYVDGHRQVSVGVGQNDHKDITVSL